MPYCIMSVVFGVLDSLTTMLVVSCSSRSIIYLSTHVTGILSCILLCFVAHPTVKILDTFGHSYSEDS